MTKKKRLIASLNDEDYKIFLSLKTKEHTFSYWVHYLFQKYLSNGCYHEPRK